MRLVSALPWLLLWSLLSAGCGSLGGERSLVDPPIDSLEHRKAPRDDGIKRWVLRVSDGRLVELEGKVNELPAGRLIFNVINRVEGARTDVDGLDLSEQAIALWIRGRGSRRHFLPEYAIGPVNAGVQEDWTVELAPGEYVLAVTLGGDSEVLLSVR